MIRTRRFMFAKAIARFDVVVVLPSPGFALVTASTLCPRVAPAKRIEARTERKLSARIGELLPLVRSFPAVSGPLLLGRSDKEAFAGRPAAWAAGITPSSGMPSSSPASPGSCKFASNFLRTSSVAIPAMSPQTRPAVLLIGRLGLPGEQEVGQHQ